MLFGLWLASGFGRRIRTPYFEGIHYDLVQGLMWVVFTEARRVLALRIETEGPSPDAHPGTPLIVACRHAGPGDSFTLIHTLMDWYGREPRVVLKDTMAWDPVVDVVLGRLPARFIKTNPGRGQDFESQIADLARGLDQNDAFVIFPEGGNFTPSAAAAASSGCAGAASTGWPTRASRMTHVLAPRPGGFLAALDAAPDADVVLVAHTGLDHMLTVRDVWRELPMDKVIVMRWWQVPREEIPDRPRGADRVALRLVGADRRLDSGEPAAGSLPRPVPAYCCGVLGSGLRRRILVRLDLDHVGRLVRSGDRRAAPRRRPPGPRRARAALVGRVGSSSEAAAAASKIGVSEDDGPGGGGGV